MKSVQLPESTETAFIGFQLFPVHWLSFLVGQVRRPGHLHIVVQHLVVLSIVLQQLVQVRPLVDAPGAQQWVPLQAALQAPLLPQVPDQQLLEMVLRQVGVVGALLVAAVAAFKLALKPSGLPFLNPNWWSMSCGGIAG